MGMHNHIEEMGRYIMVSIYCRSHKEVLGKGVERGMDTYIEDLVN